MLQSYVVVSRLSLELRVSPLFRVQGQRKHHALYSQAMWYSSKCRCSVDMITAAAWRATPQFIYPAIHSRTFRSTATFQLQNLKQSSASSPQDIFSRFEMTNERTICKFAIIRKQFPITSGHRIVKIRVSRVTRDLGIQLLKQVFRHRNLW